MATNPLQQKTRNAFILGMVTMLLVAAIVVVLLYLKISNQQKELNNYKKNKTSVYTLIKDVKSGDLITPGMYTLTEISGNGFPTDSDKDNINKILSGSVLMDTAGREINTPTTDKNYYYYKFANDANKDYIIYKDGKQATSLNPGDKAYYYDENKNQVNVEISTAKAVMARIDMKANTILTRGALRTAEEVITDDTRTEEYNVISLPVDLQPNEYVDIRFRLPTGQDYIVVSKKRVTIPIVNNQYLSDTIQMNLTEEEILLLSCAIVENFKINGSELRATRYTEAGQQTSATTTYYPSTEVQKLLKSDPNVVLKAIRGILENKQEIRNGIDAAEKTPENVQTKTQESISNTLEQRKNYLQTLVPVP